MTQNTSQDFSDTMDRQFAQALMTQLEQLIHRGDFYLIKQEHLDALAWFRNDQCQTMLKEANND